MWITLDTEKIYGSKRSAVAWSLASRHVLSGLNSSDTICGLRLFFPGTSSFSLSVKAIISKLSLKSGIWQKKSHFRDMPLLNYLHLYLFLHSSGVSTFQTILHCYQSGIFLPVTQFFIYISYHALLYLLIMCLQVSLL